MAAMAAHIARLARLFAAMFFGSGGIWMLPWESLVYKMMFKCSMPCPKAKACQKPLFKKTVPIGAGFIAHIVDPCF